MSENENVQDEPKQYVVGRVREALATDPRVNELDISVTVSGRKIYLTGDVTTPERKEAISVVVTETLPGYDVHNETSVRHYAERQDPEELS